MTAPNCTPQTIALARYRAECRTFAQFGDPSEFSGRCGWCGIRLPLFRWRDLDGAKKAGATHGAYGDGAFCTMRCGFAFALQMVMNGKALRKKTPR